MRIREISIFKYLNIPNTCLASMTDMLFSLNIYLFHLSVFL